MTELKIICPHYSKEITIDVRKAWQTLYVKEVR